MPLGGRIGPVSGLSATQADALFLTQSEADLRYLKLDTSNNPLTGNLLFSGSQKIIGGTGTTSDLTLQTTSGVGATGADMHFLVGNNGATEAMTILNDGKVGIGNSSPTNNFIVQSSARKFLFDSEVVSGWGGVWMGANALSPSATNYTVLVQDAGQLAINRIAGQVMSIRAGNATQLFIGGAGDVGIGETTVGAKLHVQGGASSVTSIFRANATSPGNLTEWQNSSGGVLARMSSGGNITAIGGVAHSISNSSGILDIAAASGVSNYVRVTSGNANQIAFAARGAVSQANDIFQVLSSGNVVLALINKDGGAVFNENGAATDFRVEGDTDASLLCTQGSTDRVGIGTATPNSKFHNTGSETAAITTVTSSSGTLGEQRTVILDATSNAVTRTLPDCTACTGRKYTLVCYNSANTVTIDTTSSQQIRLISTDTATSDTLVAGDILEVQSTGTYWQVI